MYTGQNCPAIAGLSQTPGNSSQQSIKPMLSQCCSTIYNDGLTLNQQWICILLASTRQTQCCPTLAQLWVNISCLLGCVWWVGPGPGWADVGGFSCFQFGRRLEGRRVGDRTDRRGVRTHTNEAL